MAEPLILETSREGVLLRELATPDDDIAYWQALENSRDHLLPYCAPTVAKYQSLDSVAAARREGERMGMLRFGIWGRRCICRHYQRPAPR